MEGNSEFPKGKVFLMPIILMIVIGLVLFLPAGSFSYWEAWVYLFEVFILLFFIPVYFMKRDPGLLARRNQHKEKERFSAVMLLLSFLNMASFLIPGFDYRFHWSTVPVWISIAASAIVFLGFVLIFFVFKENSFASAIIQVEQEQQVISTGPYAKVRHPMYTALLLISLFTPLALGSYLALISFFLVTPTIIFRLIKEEKLLMRDLPGYKDYCLKTPYRLIPLIW